MLRFQHTGELLAAFLYNTLKTSRILTASPEFQKSLRLHISSVQFQVSNRALGPELAANSKRATALEGETYSD